MYIAVHQGRNNLLKNSLCEDKNRSEMLRRDLLILRYLYYRLKGLEYQLLWDL